LGSDRGLPRWKVRPLTVRTRCFQGTTMTQADRDRRAYALAQEYLLGLHVPGVTAELLAEYQRPLTRPWDLTGTHGLYRRLLGPAASPGMAPTVIEKAIGGIDNLSGVTFGFDPLRVSQHYRGWQELLDEIVRTLRPQGKLRRAPSSVWVRFCCAALSGARFLVRFRSAQEFYAWADVFHDDERKVPALPLLLSREIFGFGFALACDFLMDLGYPKLTKPDVHVMAIVRDLGLCEPKADDFAVYKSVVRIARHQETTPYDVGQMFWLVGSGHFYRHRNIGKQGRIPTDRDAFIRAARIQLDQATG